MLKPNLPVVLPNSRTETNSRIISWFFKVLNF